MFYIVLSTVCLILLYKLITKNYTYWEKKNVPHEKPVPFFGNVLSVALGKESIGMAVKRLYDKFDKNAPYFGMYIIHKPFLVIKSTDMVRQVLVKDFNAFFNRPTYANENIDPVSANVLFSLKDDMWRALRRKITPIFTSGKIKMMYPLLKEVTDQLEVHLDKINGQEINVRDITKRYSTDSIASCAFGINSNSIENEKSELKRMIDQMVDVSGFVRNFSIFSFFFCPIFVRIFRLTFVDVVASTYLINLFKSVSEERKVMKVKRHDLIDCLHSIEEEEAENDIFKFDEIKMSAQAIVFFNAGSEPSAGIVSFLLYELALNSEIQNKLRLEIRENVDTHGAISYDRLNEMTYLDMVVKETLRKYPLVQFLFREATRDYTFEETGLKIEKGTPILIPMIALHLDPKYYPDPQKFDPERFRGDGITGKYAFLPFGEGPRKCIGDRFALVQMKIAIVNFLKNFEVSPSHHTEVPLKLGKGSLLLTPESGRLHLNVKKIA